MAVMDIGYNFGNYDHMKDFGGRKRVDHLHAAQGQLIFCSYHVCGPLVCICYNVYFLAPHLEIVYGLNFLADQGVVVIDYDSMAALGMWFHRMAVMDIGYNFGNYDHMKDFGGRKRVDHLHAAQGQLIFCSYHVCGPLVCICYNVYFLAPHLEIVYGLNFLADQGSSRGLPGVMAGYDPFWPVMTGSWPGPSLLGLDRLWLDLGWVLAGYSQIWPEQDVEKSSQNHQDDIGSDVSSSGQNKPKSTVIQVEAKRLIPFEQIVMFFNVYSQTIEERPASAVPLHLEVPEAVIISVLGVIHQNMIGVTVRRSQRNISDDNDHQDRSEPPPRHGIYVSSRRTPELFRMHCRAYKVIDHINPPPQPANSSTPPPKDAALTKVVDPETWSTLDAIVLKWIYGTIFSDLMHTILEPDTTAAKAWNNGYRGGGRNGGRSRRRGRSNNFHQSHFQQWTPYGPLSLSPYHWASPPPYFPTAPWS
nr:retrovirus-related Pol polyprotein from transposon TNT 1-94 [Tanacetum cinerariifolium]